MTIHRAFFKCKECGFMLTNATQFNRTIECCPACESGNIDYAPKQDRERFIRDMRDEMDELLKDGDQP